MAAVLNMECRESELPGNPFDVFQGGPGVCALMFVCEDWYADCTRVQFVEPDDLHHIQAFESDTSSPTAWLGCMKISNSECAMTFLYPVDLYPI